MRKFLGLLLFLGVAGCVTTQDINQSVAQVQSYTQTICKFVPTATVVAKILAAGTMVDTASGVAIGICDALSTAPLADGPGKPGAYYRGVRLEGKRVK